MTKFSDQVGIEVPLICGAMYPCSNPELVAAASAAGAIGIVQPLSLVYVHGYEFRAGLHHIRTLTKKPIGLNILVEKSVKAYRERMEKYVAIALDEGVRFFITALGNPKWVVDQVHARGGLVYHDVTERKWAERVVPIGIDGLICVNNRAGGHAGTKTPAQLFAELNDLGLPLICAGGIGDEADFAAALKIGFAGAQLGTRFIATKECSAHADYKNAIVKAEEKDIVLTERLTGVPVAIINTPYIQKVGTKAGPLARLMLRHHKLKHWMRLIYNVKSLWQLKQSLHKGNAYREFFQAGKSVAKIKSIEPVAAIVSRFKGALG